ncbi:MAG: TIGR02757 family protein [Prevotellaceae bacterium]|jgi:uncharacterized protein (TIGR02757 family)|nr:TIGR02757 family protein [Prevotellaceae bacterium]
MKKNPNENMLRLKPFLDKMAEKYNQIGFIENDPISIPHRFTKKQDIEIAAFFAAILAWGQRKTIISKCRQLMEMMDNTPHDFIVNHTANDIRHMNVYKHRTFNAEDLRYFLAFFKYHYQNHDSLENAFIPADFNENMKDTLTYFNSYFFSLPNSPQRTQKHIATPARKSACKRLNMFLRWMVRKDDNGVDFGLWTTIQSSQLICPIDVHVNRVANELDIICCKNADWQTAVELTNKLKVLDSEDPAKYDFALFGIGVEQNSERP